MNKSRNALDTRTLFIILLVVIMKRSKYKPIHCGSRSYLLAITINRNFTFEAVNKTGAQAIAAISAECGVPRLVHISHVNAAHDSPSEFYRTKAQGEDAVRAAFPGATIARPGPMFGLEDKFLNSVACA